MITFSERRYGAEIGGSELLIDFSDSSGGKTSEFLMKFIFEALLSLVHLVVHLAHAIKMFICLFIEIDIHHMFYYNYGY